ncbi:MAG: TRAP transporter substrate-binding protein DctP [Wenzhouxiangellaceae bacterium]|nr:TRAP transporter substrate-binding protein DctP [Wenzhouxiangellaceae bacterium]MBS3746931.1 TRAP transporter substrate-binding protein DctP [Wenzhouxiangellaceae bacterium]MBS3823777.1 TRAP transporter substrate-binding protein DctP [Wenzhouxiangellaceae bacterium]
MFRCIPAGTLLLALVLAAGPLAAQQLKIATLAPDGSTWMEVLNDAADEVRQQTGGKVVTRFYPGGVMGGSDTVLRRMKLGQLQGGVFTVGELAGMAPETNLYSLPFQFKNASELAQLRDEFDPYILDALHEAGMVAPAITNGGFAYLFSRDRIESTGDVSSSLRVWIPENDPLSRRTLEEIGASAVPMSLADVYTGLQTGTINTFANTMSGAIILQWHTRAKYMLDLPVLMTAGVMAVDRKSFERIAPEHRAIWLSVFRQALRAQEARTIEENRDARAALVEQGIEIVEPDPEDVREWQRISDRVLDDMLASGEFEVPGLDRLRARLEEIRGEESGSVAE